MTIIPGNNRAVSVRHQELVASAAFMQVVQVLHQLLSLLFCYPGPSVQQQLYLVVREAVGTGSGI